MKCAGPGYLCPRPQSLEQGLFTFSPGMRKQAAHTSTRERVPSVHGILKQLLFLSAVHSVALFLLAVFLPHRPASPSKDNRKSNRSNGQVELQSLAIETFLLLFLLFQSIRMCERFQLHPWLTVIKQTQSERQWTGRSVPSRLTEICDRCVCTDVCTVYVPVLIVCEYVCMRMCVCSVSSSTRELLNGSGHCWSHGRDNGPNNLDKSGRGLSI